MEVDRLHPASNSSGAAAARAIARARRARGRAREAQARLQPQPRPGPDRSFKCPKCEKTFTSGQALGGHLKFHNGLRRRRTQEELARHQAEPKPCPDHSFRCPKCDQTFPTGQALGGHLKFHRNDDLRRQRMTRMMNLPPCESSNMSHPSEQRCTFDTEIAADDHGMMRGSKAIQLIDFMPIPESNLPVERNAEMAENRDVNPGIEDVELDLTLRL